MTVQGHAANEADGVSVPFAAERPCTYLSCICFSTLTLLQPRCIVIVLDVHPVCYLLQVLCRTIRAPDRLFYFTKSTGPQCNSHADYVCPACGSQYCDLMFGIVLSASWLLLLMTA